MGNAICNGKYNQRVRNWFLGVPEPFNGRCDGNVAGSLGQEGLRIAKESFDRNGIVQYPLRDSHKIKAFYETCQLPTFSTECSGVEHVNALGQTGRMGTVATNRISTVCTPALTGEGWMTSEGVVPVAHPTAPYSGGYSIHVPGKGKECSDVGGRLSRSMCTNYGPAVNVSSCNGLTEICSNADGSGIGPGSTCGTSTFDNRLPQSVCTPKKGCVTAQCEQCPGFACWQYQPVGTQCSSKTGLNKCLAPNQFCPSNNMKQVCVLPSAANAMEVYLGGQAYGNGKYDYRVVDF